MEEPTEVMAIRIPRDLAAKIREVSKAENTRLGTALKFIIEQATNDNIETRLSNLEQALKSWINTQVDMSTSLALLNFRVAFLQDMFRVRFPLELTEEQKEKVWAGESGEAIKFILDGMRAQKKHYEDTKQKRHPSYKACLDALKQYQEIMQVSDNHIT